MCIVIGLRLLDCPGLVFPYAYSEPEVEATGVLPVPITPVLPPTAPVVVHVPRKTATAVDIIAPVSESDYDSDRSASESECLPPQVSSLLPICVHCSTPVFFFLLLL